MNRIKNEWADYTWNPVTGCLRNCDFCYARKLAETRLRGRFGYPEVEPFKPTFHPNRLSEPIRIKKPAKIFVVDMGDLFGEWVDSDWIGKIISVVRECPQHIFQFLTKNPKRYWEFDFPQNCWLGTSVCNSRAIENIEFMRGLKTPVKFISFEPLLSDMPFVILIDIDWIIIGAQTGRSARPPKFEWVERLLNAADLYGIPVFMKNNLDYKFKRREFPRNIGNGDKIAN